MGQIGNRLMDLFETVENEIYKKGFKNETSRNVVTLADVTDFFEKQKLVVEGAAKCMVSIQLEAELDPKGSTNKYIVRQIILDADENPIKKTSNSYYGRMLTCDDVAIDLVKVMNGNKKIIIK